MKSAFLYHKDHGGRIFTEDQAAEYHQALEDGWVDAPWEVENKDYKVTDPSFPKPEPEEETSETDNSEEKNGQLGEKKKKPGRPKGKK